MDYPNRCSFLLWGDEEKRRIGQIISKQEFQPSSSESNEVCIFHTDKLKFETQTDYTNVNV